MKTKKVIPIKEKLEGGFTRVIPGEITSPNYEKDVNYIDTAERGLDKQQLFRQLEEMYEKRVIPEGILFDYQNPKINVHDFLRDIYIKQNNSAFRNMPISIVNYNGEENPLISQIKVLAVNGSPRKKGDTRRLLEQEVERYWTGPYYSSEFVNLDSIEECLGCGGHQKNCRPECVIDDQMDELIPKVKDADVLILGSPVYMDLPTSRTIAFLSRLTGETKRNRRAYIGKYASSVSSAWCSGTKTVTSSLNNALEMMGFSIQGRSSRENIKLWRDGKTRGGVPEDFYWPD